MLDEVLTMFVRIYGKNHIKVALAESELSISLRHNGELKESKNMALSALQKLQKTDLHPCYGKVYTYVATMVNCTLNYVVFTTYVCAYILLCSYEISYQA